MQDYGLAAKIDMADEIFVINPGGIWRNMEDTHGCPGRKRLRPWPSTVRECSFHVHVNVNGICSIADFRMFLQIWAIPCNLVFRVPCKSPRTSSC